MLESLAHEHLGRERRHEDHPDVRPLLLDQPHQIDAVDLGHDHVHEHHVNGLPRRLEDFQRLRGRAGLEDPVPGFRQEVKGALAHDADVIHDQDGMSAGKEGALGFVVSHGSAMADGEEIGNATRNYLPGRSAPL